MYSLGEINLCIHLRIKKGNGNKIIFKENNLGDDKIPEV